MRERQIKKAGIVDMKKLFELAYAGDFIKLKEEKKPIKNYYDIQNFKKLPSFSFFQKQMVRFFTVKENKIRSELVSLIGTGIYNHLNKDNFVEITDFYIKAIQDNDGRVRRAIVHLAFPIQIAADIHKGARDLYKMFIIKILALIIYSERVLSEKERDTSLDELSPSLFKSLHQLYFNLEPYGDTGIFTSRWEGSSYKKIITVIDLQNHMYIFNKKMIRKEPQKVKNNFDIIMSKYNLPYTAKSQEERIYTAEISDSSKMIQEIIHSLGDMPKTKDNPEEEMQEIVQVQQDLWNYLPHKALGGQSPMERVLYFTILEFAEGLLLEK